MARGGGSITYVPPVERPHTPSFLETLLQTAPTFLQAYLQGQAFSQEKALREAQIATAGAQGRVANLEADQITAAQQANVSEGRAALSQIQQEISNFRPPTPQLPPRAASPQMEGQPVASVTGQIRQTNMGSPLSPETIAQMQSPETMRVLRATRSGQQAPELTARIAGVGQRAVNVRQRANQRNALMAFRRQVPEDLRARVDAFGALLDTQGSFNYEEARSLAQMVGLPPTRAEQIATKAAEVELQGMEDTRRAGQFATNVLRGRFPQTFGQMPEGALMPGAQETLRTLTVLDTQYAQNIALQENAHSNALKLEAERKGNQFQTLLTDQLVRLIPDLAKPYEGLDGQLYQRSPEEVSGIINGMAAQYGVELPGPLAQRITQTLNLSTITETAAAGLQEAMLGMEMGEAVTQLRNTLGTIPGITEADRASIIREATRRARESRRMLSAPTDATAVGGQASRNVYAPTTFPQNLTPGVATSLPPFIFGQ